MKSKGTSIYVEKFVKTKGGKYYCNVSIRVGNAHVMVGEFATDDEEKAKAKAKEILAAAIDIL